MSKTSTLRWNLLVLGIRAIKACDKIAYPWMRGTPISKSRCSIPLRHHVSEAVIGTVTVTPNKRFIDTALLEVECGGVIARCNLFFSGGMYNMAEEHLRKPKRFDQLPYWLFPLTQSKLSLRVAYP